MPNLSALMRVGRAAMLATAIAAGALVAVGCTQNSRTSAVAVSPAVDASRATGVSPQSSSQLQTRDAGADRARASPAAVDAATDPRAGIAATGGASEGASQAAGGELGLPPTAPVDLRAIAGAGASAPAGGWAAPLDQPITYAWPALNRWNDAMEREYSEFVARLGRAVADHQCTRLADCLRSPAANLLFDPSSDARMRLEVDCADLPYILRAYFAFKRRLPFGFVAAIQGRAGRDVRYTADVRPAAFRTWRDFRTARSLLSGISSMVHSGMYRTAPDVQNGDFYPVSVTRRAVRPGTVFYDPNGHVLVVTEVRADGVVHFIDGHPDGSLTWKRFGQAFVVGTARFGGGFKNFRPQTLEGARIVRAANGAIPDFDGRAQFERAVWRVQDRAATYHAWVRAALAEANTRIDPVTEFREQVRALCRDVADRAAAVDMALAAGLQHQAHPAALPANIYGTEGDWELYSTPSRDARLKAAFRELREMVSALPGLTGLVPVLRTAWAEEAARAECQFGYQNSAGQRVALTLDTVLDRLFALSFDPYHCAELRWGARVDTPEGQSCPDDARKRWWYQAEQRLRNRIDREYGQPTPLEFGPVDAPDVDVRRLLGITLASR